MAITWTAGQIAGQITAHAMVGGVSTALSGGKFGHGFISAGITKGLGGAFLPTESNWSAIANGAQHDGQVLHIVAAEKGIVYLNTYGTGTGPNPTLNNIAGNVLFGKMHFDVWSGVKTQQIKNFYSDLFK